MSIVVLKQGNTICNYCNAVDVSAVENYTNRLETALGFLLGVSGGGMSHLETQCDLAARAAYH